MTNIILKVTPEISLNAALAIKGDKGDTGATGPQGIQGLKGDKGDTGQAGGAGDGRKAFKPGAGAVIGSVHNDRVGIEVYGPTGEPVERVAPFAPKFDFLTDRIGVFVIYASETSPGYDDRIVIYESDADGRPTGTPTLSSNVDATQVGLRDAPISFSFQKDKLYWIGIRSSFRTEGRQPVYSEILCSGANGADSFDYPLMSLRRAVAVDDVTDYPAYSNDLLSAENPVSVLMRIAE